MSRRDGFVEYTGITQDKWDSIFSNKVKEYICKSYKKEHTRVMYCNDTCPYFKYKECKAVEL